MAVSFPQSLSSATQAAVTQGYKDAAAPKSIQTLRYPYKKLTDSDDYLLIKIIAYQPPGISSGTNNFSFRTSTQSLQNNIKTPEAIILLPIPQNVQDQNSVNWGDSTLNAFELAGAEAVSGVIRSKKLEGIGKELSNFASKFQASAVTGNLQDQTTSLFSAAALQTLNANVQTSDLVARTSGQVLNPNMELLFRGVSLREFAFEYDLAPRDGNEAKEIKKIITTLKRAQAARTSATNSPGSGLFISAPRVFQLEYRSGNKKHPFLHSFKPMAMKGMAVNYTGSGNYSVYGDSTPVHMKISMNFQELNPIYFEDYSDQDTGVGY